MPSFPNFHYAMTMIHSPAIEPRASMLPISGMRATAEIIGKSPDAGSWTRASVDHTATHDRKIYPKPLGVLLSEKNEPKLNRREAGHSAYLRSLLDNNSLDHLNVGREIGRGGKKTAYDLPGTGRALVTNPGSNYGLVTEIVNINRLKNAGVPTAKILDVGNFHGSPAMVMEKFEDVIKPMSPKHPSGEEFIKSKLTNRRTLDSLVELRNAMHREKLIIYDLQFGIRKDGSLGVLDPLYICGSDDDIDNESQLKLLDEIVGAMKKKVGASNHR